MKAHILRVDDSDVEPRYDVQTEGGILKTGVPSSAFRVAQRPKAEARAAAILLAARKREVAVVDSAVSKAIAETRAAVMADMRGEMQSYAAALRAEIASEREAHLRGANDLVTLLNAGAIRETQHASDRASLVALVERLGGQIPAAMASTADAIRQSNASLEAAVRAPVTTAIMRKDGSDTGPITGIVQQRERPC